VRVVVCYEGFTHTKPNKNGMSGGKGGHVCVRKGCAYGEQVVAQSTIADVGRAAVARLMAS